LDINSIIQEQILCSI